MADEAHRGQYGLAEKIKITKNEDGEEIAKRIVGTARIIRNSLPNAAYIGFTGTPIFSADRSTREVFGEYIDIYDMTQAVEDGATRPVYYESRVIKLKLDENTLKLIDAEYDIMAANADAELLKRANVNWVKWKLCLEMIKQSILLYAILLSTMRTTVAKVAYPKFLEKLSICRDLFHGYDYFKFTTGSDLERAKTISGANFIIDREREKEKETL